jgi:hypothetical protein
LFGFWACAEKQPIQPPLLHSPPAGPAQGWTVRFSSQTGSTSGIGYPSPTVGRAARNVEHANFALAALRASARTSSLPVHPGGRLPRKIEALAGERRGIRAQRPVHQVRRQQECYT